MAPPRRLKQFVLKPTVYCFHRCPYCDLRQDYYRDMVADRKSSLRLLPDRRHPDSRTPATCRWTWPCGRSTRPPRWAWRNSSSAAEIRSCTHTCLTSSRRRNEHPGVFVLMNSVGTGVTVDKARTIIDAGLGAWNFSVDTLDAALYEKLRWARAKHCPRSWPPIETVRADRSARSGVPDELHDRHHARQLPPDSAVGRALCRPPELPRST